MAAVGDLVVNLIGKTNQYQSAMARARAATSSTMNAIKSTIGKIAAVVAPLGGALSFAGALRSGDEFNQAMRSSTAVMVGLSDVMQGRMREAALEVGKTSMFGATEAAKGFYYLASAGLDAEQQIAALPAVARFAQAGQFDLAKATELSMDALKSMGLESKDPQKNMEAITRTTDVLARVTTLANATTEQFAVALARGGPSLRIYGKSIEEGVAVLGAYADQGVKAEEGGTAVTQVLRDLARSATKTPKAFTQAGIAVFDAGGKMRNVADIIADFEAKLGGLSDQAKTSALMKLGVPFKSVRALMTLMGKSDAIRKFQEELEKAGGYTKAVAEKQISVLRRGVQALKTEIVDLGSKAMDSIGAKLGPVLQWTATGFRSVFDWVVRTYEAIAASPVGTFISQFSRIALVGAAVMGMVVAVRQFGTALSMAFSVITGPLGAFIALATIAGAVIVETTGKGETFGEKLNNTLSKIPDIMEGLAFAFRNFGAVAQIALIDLVQSAIDLFPGMEGPIASVAKFFIGTFAGLKEFFSAIIQNIIGGLKEVSNFAQAVGAGLMAAWEEITSGEWSSVAEKFGTAFTDALAKQADVQAPNAFNAFKEAYDKAGGEFAGGIERQGGLSKALANQKQALLDSVAEQETKLAKTKTATEVPKAAETAKVLAQQTEERKRAARAPIAGAAMQIGSAEAWKTILSSMRGGKGDAMEKVADNTADLARNSERTNELLDQMANDDDLVVNF